MTWTSQKLLDAVAHGAPDDCLTDARLVELTGLTLVQVQNCLFRLRRAGFMARSAPGCHTLTRAGRTFAGKPFTSGPRGPETGRRLRDPGLRQRVWNALRLGRKVSIDDILLLAVAGGERDAAGNVGKYLRALARAGYVRRLPVRETPASPTSNGAIRWQLVSDTGPRAPVASVVRNAVYDPNLEEDIPMARELADVRRRSAA